MSALDRECEKVIDRFCTNCGRQCRISKFLYSFNENNGEAIYHYRVKCPKYHFFSSHSDHEFDEHLREIFRYSGY